MKRTHIDFGFSDEITSEAVVTNYPTLLQGMVSPQVKGYPVESVITEKFHAMQHYAEIASSWKDYYDLWLISESFELDDQSLQRAIAKTFENRDTIIPAERPISLTVDFAIKNRQGWSTFVKKYDLENDGINALLQLAEKRWAFIEWPLQGLAAPDIQQNQRRWIPGKRKRK